MRKFAKVTLLHKETLHTSPHLKHDAPEPLDEKCTYNIFKERILLKPHGKIKQVLMDPSIIAGIGNIYSDEILWKSGIHPLSKPQSIPETLFRKMYENTKEILRKGIRLGGDSTSDYRTLTGIAGEFQGTHNAYQRHNNKCTHPKCTGTIERIKINTRSTHFCNSHQKLYS
jgi:formamidopyrimidine-DNA glycosylase